jgi:hypothetical protein
MCINKEVSLLSGINSNIIAYYLYNRNYKYDRMYSSFIFSFSLIQFCDYFLWQEISLGNTNTNLLITKYFIPLIISLQPLAIYYGYSSFQTKQNLVEWIVYILFFILFFKEFSNASSYTKVSKCGHLDWASEATIYTFIGGVLLVIGYIYPLLKIRDNTSIIYAILTILTFLYAFIFTDSVGSNWCFYANLFVFVPLMSPYIDKYFN